VYHWVWMCWCPDTPTIRTSSHTNNTSKHCTPPDAPHIAISLLLLLLLPLPTTTHTADMHTGNSHKRDYIPLARALYSNCNNTASQPTLNTQCLAFHEHRGTQPYLLNCRLDDQVLLLPHTCNAAARCWFFLNKQDSHSTTPADKKMILVYIY